MKINPITKELFTDEDELITQLYCPNNVRWDEQIVQEGNVGKDLNPLCAECDREIVDASNYRDHEVLQMIRANEKRCIKLNLESGNVKVIIQ